MSHQHTATPDPEHSAAARVTQLTDLAAKIESWREAHNTPKAQMERRFSTYIRSYRNIERAVKRETGEMDIEKNLSAFSSIWSLLNTPDAKVSERAYDDFTAAARLRHAFMRTMTKTGPNRVILVIGPTGAGKTKAREVLQNTWKTRIASLDATRAWDDRSLGFLSAIWHALGRSGAVGHSRDGLVRIIHALREERRALLIDEAHYLGPNQLNIVTTLVNNTPGEFILIGQPTLWSRLETDRGAYLEARQLTQNRLSRRINLNGAASNDVELMIERRLAGLPASARSKAAQLIMAHAGSHGNLGFVRNVIERCEETMSEAGTECTLDLFTIELRNELSER